MVLLGLFRHYDLDDTELRRLRVAHDTRISVRRADVEAALAADSDHPPLDPLLPAIQAMTLNVTRIYGHTRGLSQRDGDGPGGRPAPGPGGRGPVDVEWRPISRQVRWRWSETAVIVVDMWDTHPDQFFLQRSLTRSH